MQDSPSDYDFLRVHLVVEFVHRVDVRVLQPKFAGIREFAMKGCEATVHFDLCLCPCPEQAADDSVLRVFASQEMIEDREQCNWVDRNFLNCASANFVRQPSMTVQR